MSKIIRDLCLAGLRRVRHKAQARRSKARRLRVGQFEDRVLLSTIQWTGAAGAASGDTHWSNAANWAGGVVPGSSDTVLFTNNAQVKDFTSTVDTSFTVADVNVDTSWGGTINVNGSLSATSGFTLGSGSLAGSGAVVVSGPFNFDGGSISDSVAVQNSTLNIAAAATGAASFVLQGSDQLTGNIAAGQTLTVQANSTYGSVTLTVPSGMVNAGTIYLDNTSSNGWNASLTTSGTLTNAASGTIEALTDGGGGQRYVNGNVVNQGTVTTDSGGIALTFQNETFTTTGTLSGNLTFSSDTFNLNGGTLGSQTLTSSAFNFNGGTISGTVTLAGTSSLSLATANAASFVLQGNTNLTGNIAAGQTLTVQANSTYGSVTLTVPDGTVNAGTIYLDNTSSNGWNASLTTSGTLTNAASGTIEALTDGGGGQRYVNGTVVNQGTVITDSGGIALTFQNETFTTTGTLSGNLTFSSDTFTLNGGTLGSQTLAGSTFNFNGGTISGTVTLTGSSTLNLATTHAGSFVLQANANLTGNIAAGQTLTVQANNTYGPVTLTVPDGTVNAGTIYLDNTSSNGWNASLTTSGTLTNAASGAIEALTDGGGGQRYINGTVVNQGTITTDSGGSALTFQNETFTSSGGTLSGNLSFSSDTFNLNGGTLGSQTLTSSAFNFNGGTISGTVTLAGTSSLNLATTNAGSFVFQSSGNLSGNLAAGQTLTVQANNTYGPVTLTVPDGTVNAGTIYLDNTSSNGWNASLTTSGTLTNAASGAIEALTDGGGGQRYITGTIDNDGLIGITPGITLTFTGQALTNEAGGLISGGGGLDTSAVTYTNNGVVDLTMPAIDNEQIQTDSIQISYAANSGMNAATVTNAANYTVIGSGGTGVFPSSENVNEDNLISGITYDNATGIATIAFSQDLPNDFYQVSISGNSVLDSSGNALYSGGQIVLIRALGQLPAAAAVTLDPASATGAPDHPSYTSVTAPTFDVQVNRAGTITMDFDGNAAHDQTLAVQTAGVYTFTAPSLADGTYTSTATFASVGAGTAVASMIYIIDTRVPSVTALGPTGIVNTYVSQATVTFSEPVDLGKFTPGAITLTGPNGAIPVSQPELVSGTTYSIPFATQTTSGQYSLTIAQTVTNFAGTALGQSASTTWTISLADLQVQNLALVSPANPQSGSLVTIQWDDANAGSAAASGSWNDQVAVVNTGTGQTVYSANVPVNGNIAAGSQSLQSYSFALPDGDPGTGQLKIIVTADANQNIAEVTYNNNSSTIISNSTLAPYPDLRVTNLSATPTNPASGGMLTLNWSDANTGNASASAAFFDLVNVVNTTTGQVLVNTAVEYDEAVSGAIPAGGSSPQSYSFALPNGNLGAGNLVITVTTNYTNSVFVYDPNVVPGGHEAAENEATSSVNLTSTLAPYPDLTASNVTGPTNVVPGQQITVGWTLANTGTAAANGPWTEQVFLASDSAGDNRTLVGAVTYAGPLAVNQSVSRSATVQVPNVASGTYWLEVWENPLGEVFETNTANNTAVASQSTTIQGALTLSVASTTISDGAGANATTATVTRNTDTTNALVVALSVNSAELAVPATVTIPAGDESVTFSVGTVNPDLVVGTQTATLTAAASGLVSGNATLSITDVNLPTLTVSLNNHLIDENATNPAATGTVTRNTSTASALVVYLVSDTTNKLTVPASVTIPAGQASATFPVTVVNDNQIDGDMTATISASLSGFISGSDSAVVVDQNIPTLSLTLAQATVSEAAQNPATLGTVSIASPATFPITIALTSSNTTAATVPQWVVIDTGHQSASFPITAVDDGLVTGNKTALITASVETNAGVILGQGSANANLLLDEADGPALTLSFTLSAVLKGTTTTATVTRNTSTTNALVVNLSTSDATKATVPATVTIPAGQASATFTVTTIDDHTPDGLQQIQVSASANGFDTGLAPLGITDVDLPDLVVSSVTAPASGYDNTALTISWTVTNTGLYTAAGAWSDQVYLDPVGGPQSSTPVDTVPFTGVLNPGQGYTQTDSTLHFPSTVGQYTVRIVTDVDHSLQELSFPNNTGTMAQPLVDQPLYQATVSTTVGTVPNGTPIPLSGTATMTSNGALAANVPVSVDIMVNGTMRTLTATTDSNGHYSITFQPLPYEAGSYTVAAADPGVTNPPAQASFTIVGMTAAPPTGNVNIVPNTPLSGQFTLTNLSSLVLTGVTATASGGPAGLTVQLSAPSQINGNGTATLAYTLSTTATQAASGVVTIHITSTQGAVLNILLGVSVLPLTPVLATNPGFLDTGMVVGSQSMVSFTVVNNGGAPSGDLQVALPAASWLSLASAPIIPSLAPGASAIVLVQLTPGANLPLQQYTGTIGIGNGQTVVSVPFTFTATTTAVGDVHILVDDDFTFNEPGLVHVQGATVDLLNPYDNTQVIATGVTDATGVVTFHNVQAGPYTLRVEASGHSTYEKAFTVTPGITNNDEVFLPRQFVSFNWVVQQTTIQDTDQVQLQTTFETDVPAPVVVVSGPATLPDLQPGQTGTINVTVTNHGLIAAQDVTLFMPIDPEYTLTALTDHLGVLPALSSVVVPITVTRGSISPALSQCAVTLLQQDYYECHGTQVVQQEPWSVDKANAVCTLAAEVDAVLSALGGFGIGTGSDKVAGYLVGEKQSDTYSGRYSCWPTIIHQVGLDLGLTGRDAADPPVNTAPAVAGTDQAAAALGPPSNPTPATFIATALGNLGLINGQTGNSGNSAAVTAQMPSTLATFTQVEADLANVLAEFAAAGNVADIASDVSLLQQVDTRLKAVTIAENTLFGGDPDWLASQEPDTLQQWLTTFFGYAQDSSDGGETITSAERTQLLATTLPSTVTTTEANEFLDRWNRTVQYWGQGIYTASQVPAGQSTDFLDVGVLQSVFNTAQNAELQSQVNGSSDPLAETTAAITTVQNDLAQQGVCATIKLQIDQTATMTRSAFSGTLAVTNTEASGSLTNVVLSINITDDLGNPANGKFFVSSPTYSGAFNVVNGSATLPDNATGNIAFTFIPDDAAASAPTIYHIGGTFSFTDPSGVNVSDPIGAAAIMVYPQAELQLNYFLQRDVIGLDPFSADPIPSEPAVLGLLVTNSGKGTANDFSITTAQPQIVQNNKGLLNTFQIVGTQVGSQQVTPSLTVDLGNIAPGQTADADFLLVSMLQGIFENFSASFTHSDALGGLATSLIQSVQTHTLIHAGNFNYANSTGAMDYLAEDNANPANLPDTIYFSDGTKAPVNLATNAASAPAGANTFSVTASVTSGWDYILLPDPGAGYTLSEVVRSDGTVIPVSDQAWTTDRTFNAAGNSTIDHELHLLDYNSTGSYTVYYVPSAPQSRVSPLPAVESSPSFTLNWSGAAGSSGAAIASYTIYVSDNSGPFTAFLTGTTQTSATFTGTPGHTYGFYSVATDTAGNVQPTPAGAQATTQVVAPADVSVSVTPDAGTVNAGDPVGFTVTLTNLGTATATGVSLNDLLPPGLGNDLNWLIDPNLGNPSDFQINGGTLSLNGLSSLDTQQSISVHVTAVSTALDVNTNSLTGTLTNSATVTAANEAAADQNQQAAATITVNAPAVTVLVAANQSPIAAGQTAGFTLTVTNGGPGIAHGVTLSDALPEGLGNDITWQIASNPSGLFVLTGNVLSLQNGLSLPAGQSITVVVTGVTSNADIDPQTLTGTLLDTATVNASNEPAADQNQQSSASITIVGGSAVRFRITPSVTTTVAGTAFNITVTALNAANGTATNYTGTIHFTTSSTKYVLPANYTFTAADAGTHTFIIKLETAGIQSVTATDINKASMTGQTSLSTELAITTSASSPEGITVGPDGNLWFVETNASQIGMSTPTGSMTEFALPTGSQPVSIVKGPDGNLWFTEEGTNKIGRLTTAGVLTQFAVPMAGSHPYGIAVGSDGNLWFTELTGNKIGKITPAGVFKEFTLPAGSAPEGITAGPDKKLWFTESGTSKVAKIATTGAITTYVLATGSSPAMIVAGSDKKLWVTEPGSNAMAQITTAGVIVTYTVPTASSQPWGITAGPDGALWFTELASNLLGRITTKGVIVEFPIATSGSQPFGIVTGPDKNVWWTEAAGSKLGQLDPGVLVTPTAAKTLKLTGLASATAGSPYTITVTALDPYGNIATGYRGTIHFTCTDTAATLPQNYTFTSTDAGVHAFTGGITLHTAGTQTLTATDTQTKTITGKKAVSVTAPPAAQPDIAENGLPIRFAATTVGSPGTPSDVSSVQPTSSPTDTSVLGALAESGGEAAARTAPEFDGGLSWASLLGDGEEAIWDPHAVDGFFAAWQTASA